MQPTSRRRRDYARYPSPATATPCQAERWAATEGLSTMVLAPRPLMETNGHVTEEPTNGSRGRTPAGAPAQATGLTARQAALNQIANQRVASTQDYLARAGADIYGEYVFGEDAQRQYWAKPIFAKLRRTISGLEPFD